MNKHRAVRFGISLGLVASGWSVLHPRPALAAGPVRVDLESSQSAMPGQQLAGAGEQRAVALAHYLVARNLEVAGRGREALPHYLNFLKGDTGEPDLVAHIAELAQNYQGQAQAVALLEQAIKAHPASPAPSQSLVAFCLTHGTPENGLLARALQVAEEAVARFPREAGVYEGLVKLHLTQGRREQAAQVLQRAIEQAASSPGLPGDAAFWMGLARLAQEVWPIADQENRAAHVALVNAFVSRARQAAQAAWDETALIGVADYFLFSNQLDQAAAICEELVARSSSLDARKRLVRLYEAMERPEDSFHALEALVQAFPNDVEHRRMLGTLYVQKQDIPKAADQFEAALQAGGGELGDYLYVAKLLRFAQDPARFEKFTQRAQQLFPAEPRLTYHRAIALNQSDQYAEAARLFGEAARQAETTASEMLDDQFHFNWGVALERSRQFDAAARQFEKSITLTPAHDPPRAANTMNYLGYMWLEQGQNLDKAEQLIRKANELEQNNAAFVDSLGWLLFKRGKTQEALAELLRAENLMKEFSDEGSADAEILDHIAQAYDQLGQKEEAKAYWKRVLDASADATEARERARKALGLPPSPAPETKPAPTNPDTE